MNAKEILAKYIRFKFEGVIVETSQNYISANTFGFEFRNLGTTDVTINGILLPPPPSTDNVFIETFIDTERTHGNYNIVFPIGGGTKKLLIIEKFPVF